MKFQNELNKYAFQRVMQRLGLRIDSARHGAFSYDARNYSRIPAAKQQVIFDVGANIGQSAIWYARSFPSTVIYCFEPFRIIYEQLTRNVKGYSLIQCQNLALLDGDKEMHVPTVSEAFFQGGKVISSSPGTASERISVRTVDSFVEEQKIEHIHILKTDTEGFDLQVLSGAERMLKRGKISWVLTEATLFERDLDHTKLSALIEVLGKYSFRLHGLYDLHYSASDGGLEYCNALFYLDKA